MSVAGVPLERLPLVTYTLLLEPPFPALYVSPQMKPLFGLDAADSLGREDVWTSRVDADDLPLLRAGLERSRKTHEQMSVEYRVTTGDGRRVWVRDVGVVATDDGRPPCLHGYLTDVTREKELERELASTRAQADAFFRDSSVGLAIADDSGRYVRVNEALARMSGRSLEELQGKTLSEVAPAIDERVRHIHEQVRATDVAVHQHELSYPADDGSLRHVLLTVFPLELDCVRHYGRIVVDITEQRVAEAERAEAEQQYRRLIEQLPLVTYVNEIEPVYRATYVSKQIEEVYGYPVEDWLADAGLWDRVVHPADFELVAASEARARASREPFELEYRIVRADGTVGWVLDLMETVYDADGTPLYEQGFIVDITRRRESEVLFRAIFDHAFEAVLIADEEGRYVDVNKAACELFGRTREELIGLTAGDVTTGFDAERACRSVQATGEAAGHVVVVRPDGEERETEFAVKADVLPGRHLSVLRDVTQRRRLERELWRAQKLESVGRLAGGVAHDFNNMLTAIRGYAQLLRARTSPETSEHHHAEEIDRAAERAATLTAQLLAFGRRQTLQARPVDLNRLVEDLGEMLGRLVPDGCELLFELDPTVRAAHVDPSQIQQVLLNLVANAVDATGHGGRIVVRTAREAIEAGDVDERSVLPEGRYTIVSVEDSGAGIDESMLEHLFEPFFTTKAVGAGSGLGLATSYGIARQSGGTIVVSSAPGRGSTFSVYLPEAVLAGVPAAEPPAGGGETILVVERDPAVGDVVFGLLADSGYRVLTAHTAADAVRLVERLEGTVDLLLTDLADRRSDGLVEALHTTCPGLRTLSLQKPYAPDRFRTELRLALDVTGTGDDDLGFGLHADTTSD